MQALGMHAPKSRPSAADLPMPDRLKDRLLISLANRFWAKEAELLFCNKLGKPTVRNKVALKLQETLKSLGIERDALHAFRLRLAQPMHSYKPLIVLGLGQTICAVSGGELVRTK